MGFESLGPGKKVWLNGMYVPVMTAKPLVYCSTAGDSSSMPTVLELDCIASIAVG